MKQFSFFDEKPKYPHAPGFAKKRPTSKAAADTVWQPTEREKIVMEALSVRPMTDHELVAHTGKAMCVIQPRRSGLTGQGKVMDSGDTRLTPYGKKAVVWKLVGAYDR